MQKRTRSTRSPGAFSLVELLVVIALIGLLTSLLLPALASARAAGHGAACLSNLRQLGIALDTYANENKGLYAPAAPQIATLNRVRWFGSRPGGTGAFASTGGPLSEFLAESQGARRCGALISTGGGFERAAGGYGYNAAFVGTSRARDEADPARWIVTSDRTGSAQTRFKTPAETLAFADAALSTTSAGVIEYSFIEPDQWPDNPGTSPDPSVHFRHGSRQKRVAQAVLLDGHARTLPLGQTVSTSVYGTSPAQAGLGWPQTSAPNAWFDYD